MLVLDVLALQVLPPADDPRWAAWLTPRELASCRSLARAAEHLGARVAAKRALCRVLAVGGVPPWRDIEIGRAPFRPPGVSLTGSVERHRVRHGHPAPGLSLSHAGGYAAALAWLPAVGSPAVGSPAVGLPAVELPAVGLPEVRR